MWAGSALKRRTQISNHALARFALSGTHLRPVHPPAGDTRKFLFRPGAAGLFPTCLVSMSEALAQQETLVRSFVDLVLNQRHLRLLPEFISLDVLEYSPFILSAAHEAQDFAHDVQRVLTAFADLRISVGQVINAPGRAALRFALSGSNTGPLPWTARPTQRRASWSAMAMLTLDGGRIGEIRGVADRFSMLDQLGLTGVAARK